LIFTIFILSSIMIKIKLIKNNLFRIILLFLMNAQGMTSATAMYNESSYANPSDLRPNQLGSHVDPFSYQYIRSILTDILQKVQDSLSGSDFAIDTYPIHLSYDKEADLFYFKWTQSPPNQRHRQNELHLFSDGQFRLIIRSDIDLQQGNCTSFQGSFGSDLEGLLEKLTPFKDYCRNVLPKIIDAANLRIQELSKQHRGNGAPALKSYCAALEDPKSVQHWYSKNESNLPTFGCTTPLCHLNIQLQKQGNQYYLRRLTRNASCSGGRLLWYDPEIYFHDIDVVLDQKNKELVTGILRCTRNAAREYKAFGRFPIGINLNLDPHAGGFSTVSDTRDTVTSQSATYDLLVQPEGYRTPSEMGMPEYGHFHQIPSDLDASEAWAAQQAWIDQEQAWVDQEHAAQTWAAQEHAAQAWADQEHAAQAWIDQEHAAQAWIDQEQAAQTWVAQEQAAQTWVECNWQTQQSELAANGKSWKNEVEQDIPAVAEKRDRLLQCLLEGASDKRKETGPTYRVIGREIASALRSPRLREAAVVPRVLNLADFL